MYTALEQFENDVHMVFQRAMTMNSQDTVPFRSSLIYANDATARSSSQAGVHVPEEQPDVLGDGAHGMAPEASRPAAGSDHAGGKRGRNRGHHATEPKSTVECRI
ncbi:unnamed protein product [Urochloa humidicola]